MPQRVPHHPARRRTAWGRAARFTFAILTTLVLFGLFVGIVLAGAFSR